MNFDSAHVALYAAVIGAGAAILAQCVAITTAVIRDTVNRRQREARTRAVFVALVRTAESGFYLQRASLEQVMAGDTTFGIEAIRMAVAEPRSYDVMAQPLRSALTNYDLLRDLPARTIQAVLAVDMTIHFSTRMVLIAADELNRNLDSAPGDEARAEQAVRTCWNLVEQAIAAVEDDAEYAIERLGGKPWPLKLRDSEVPVRKQQPP